MHFAHLVHDTAFHFDTKGFPLIECAHQAEIASLLQVVNEVALLVRRTLKEIVQQAQAVSLLLCSDLDPACKVMNFGLLIILAPHLSLKDFNIE